MSVASTAEFFSNDPRSKAEDEAMAEEIGGGTLVRPEITIGMVKDAKKAIARAAILRSGQRICA